MRQIRARIREKRGVDYTEEQIRELANVKLEKFLDPKACDRICSSSSGEAVRPRPASPTYAFEDTTLYRDASARPAFMRKLLNPLLKLFFNPNPVIEACTSRRSSTRLDAAPEPLTTSCCTTSSSRLTRTGIEVKNLKMRLESMASRLDFDERRARALEGVVQYRPGRRRRCSRRPRR